MKRNHLLKLSLIVIILIAMVTIIFFIPKPKLHQCPDAWIQNAMPGVSDARSPAKEYFVVKGERKEVGEFDLQWVKENCKIEPMKVY